MPPSVLLDAKLRALKRALATAAVAATGSSAAFAAHLALPRLRWEPVRPLVGPGDWLERLRVEGDGLE